MSSSGPPADAKQAQAAALAELEAANKRKRVIDTSLVRSQRDFADMKANLEESIYRFEGSYLEETAASGGNIIKVSKTCILLIIGFRQLFKTPHAYEEKAGSHRQ